MISQFLWARSSCLAQPGSLFRLPQGCHQGVGRAEFSSGSLTGEASISKLSRGVFRINFLAAVTVRVSACAVCWLEASHSASPCVLPQPGCLLHQASGLTSGPVSADAGFYYVVKGTLVHHDQGSGRHIVTFAIFSGLNGNHQNHPHSRVRDFIRAWTPGGRRSLGVTFVSVHPTFIMQRRKTCHDIKIWKWKFSMWRWLPSSQAIFFLKHKQTFQLKYVNIQTLPWSHSFKLLSRECNITA